MKRKNKSEIHLSPRKPTLLIDTNSFSHLCEIEIQREHAHKWLWRYFNVFTCQTVKEEFLHHISRRPDVAKFVGRKLKKSVIPTRYTKVLEAQWLSDDYYKKSLSTPDAGERHLLCTAIELGYLHTFAWTRCILISDDHTAKDAFMNAVQQDFYFGEIWTVLDLVVFMFYSLREMSFNQEEQAIRDLSASRSISVKEYRRQGYDEESDARLAMLRDYMNKLHHIQKLRDLLPR